MTIRENYEQWLKDFAGDAETVRELEAIRDDEKEMEDRFYTELNFGTAGMPGYSLSGKAAETGDGDRFRLSISHDVGIAAAVCVREDRD